MFTLNRLPSPALVRVIAYSDPATWWALGDSYICALINSTSFRCGWVSHLAKGFRAPAAITCIEDIDTQRRKVLDPVTSIFGSEAWISGNFVRALSANYPATFNAIALGLVKTLLLNGDRNTAALVIQRSHARLDIFDGRFVRDLVVQRPEMWMLQWLAVSGLDFEELYSRGHCFDMSQLTDWVMASRVELLRFLAGRGLRLPVRSLMEYALGHSQPDLVEFLIGHDSGYAHELSWNDLLLMACTEASTRLDVFVYVASKTEPSIVWAFAAACLASHAMADDCAYKKFMALRSLPNAAEWIVKPIRGQTPIERLCERLTYENIAHISPFIRDYIALGVSTANMPSIVSALCQ
ncbi:hypothetical protein IWW51_004567 [Coemansia sp. RSA 2702]|nr:hypothetical protein IWW54_005268 [Coemansia sp. RSA 2705]KAJ2320746.1 hypothetical protein IWW51_004567 [Coemansia sp. RSA 2702]